MNPSLTRYLSMMITVQHLLKNKLFQFIFISCNFVVRQSQCLCIQLWVMRVWTHDTQKVKRQSPYIGYKRTFRKTTFGLQEQWTRGQTWLTTLNHEPTSFWLRTWSMVHSPELELDNGDWFMVHGSRLRFCYVRLG